MEKHSDLLARYLMEADLGPYFGTPCGVLAPLYEKLESSAGLVTIPREDNAIGIAVGAALTGARPVVLMQNSGLGQSVNALTSLVVAYGIPILLIVSLRGTGPDRTTENLGMGLLTSTIFDQLNIPSWTITKNRSSLSVVNKARAVIEEEDRAAAVLVAPDAFGWRP